VRYAYGVTSALLIGGAAVSVMTGIPAGAQVAQNDAAQMQAMVPRAGAPASFAELTEQLQPAVVNIATRQRVRVANGNPFAGTPFEDLFGGGQGGNRPTTREGQSLGSGFVISADGYVVTNNHVVTPEGQGEIQSISVTLSDGTEYAAKLVGRDAQSDLAVLKIDAGKNLPFVKFGNSEAARVGDWVIAIGNPFGLGGTVTSGIVSAVHRSSGASRYIQTDASINRGNSGGPLFDMKGNVIGINNAIFSPTGGNVGIGFAIPADIASPIIDKLVKGQTIERGYLGVQIVSVTEDVADSLGLPRNRGELVQTVQPGQAAAAAGLQPGDVVVKVDGKDVSPDQTLSFIVANTAPGKRIPLDIIRNGKRMALTATVGKRPSEDELASQTFAPGGQERDDAFNRTPERQGEGLAERALGLSVLPMTPQIAGQIGLPSDTRGLVISVVDGTSDAGTKGLQRGDVILSVNYRDLATTADLEAAIRAAKAENRAAMLLRVQRRGQPAAYIPVRLR
jgi:serine protease Do